MYVPGTMKNSNRVIVDVGTGYYVEKTIPEANDFFQRRMDHVAEQLNKIQPALSDKQKLLEAVTMILQLKMQAFVGLQQDKMKKELVKS
jgi:prefoldin alpha subunit